MKIKSEFKYKKWNQVLDGFDLGRIKQIPVAEKFKIVEIIKMIAKEADYAKEHGYKNLVNSDFYKEDQTYRLVCFLYIKDVSFNDIKSIILNYLNNYKLSDVYYCKFAIIGIGVIMLKLGRDSKTIFNALMVLLGQDFLTYNLKLFGYENALKEDVEVLNTIRYKEYEQRYKEKKYKLLALGYMAKLDGIDYVRRYFDEVTDNQKAKLYFSILSNMNEEFVYRSYHFLEEDADNMDKMILAGIYCILGKKKVLTSHYMMNSCIGKYDHCNERLESVEKKVVEVYNTIKEELEKE